MISQWQLRAAFARRLCAMYGAEVPAYTTLVEASREVNDDVLRARGGDAERLGSLDRVSAERHGAIRVGTPRELARATRVFGAMGMHPVGFYDLREAAVGAVPVVSTAFRPVDAAELALNPFRLFTSLLTTADPRFFDVALRRRLEEFLAARELFSDALLELADRAAADGGLERDAADRFLGLAVRSLRLSAEPVDRAWYAALEKVSAVAADIGGVRGTHVNHLTPRVLDIDELYRRMTGRGVAMIDEIQGPPRWSGPDVLLRQTSFRALAEPRALREADGRVTRGSLRVRFGEVEARGIALTRPGHARYDALLAETDARLAAGEPAARQEVARAVWEAGFPRTEHELAVGGLAFFTYHAVPGRPGDGRPSGGRAGLAALLGQGRLRADPVVYEDFLPRSAAGIFQSNLGCTDARGSAGTGPAHDRAWLSGAAGREVLDPFELYAQQSRRSLERAARTLGLAAIR